MLVTLSGVCAVWAVAEFYAIGPRALMTASEADRKIDPEIDWSVPYEMLKSTSKWKFKDADTEFELGRLLWWRASVNLKDESLRKDLLDKSSHHLQKSIYYRRNWGRAWAELANVYFQQKNYLKAKRALLISIRRSPYEGTHQWMMLWTGFGLWNLLDWREKEDLIRLAEHVLLHGAPHTYSWVTDPAVAFGRENQIREAVVKNPLAHKRLVRKLEERDIHKEK